MNDGNAAQSQSKRPKLLAGVSKVCITPPIGTWQGGYGARKRPSEGVHNDLFARALVIEGSDGNRCAIVSVDILGFTHELADGTRRLAEELSGVPAGNIALCTSHTHWGPATRPTAGFPQIELDGDYLAVLQKHVAGAVAAAAQELEPVIVSLGRGEASFNVNRRRRNPDGTIGGPDPSRPADKSVPVIRLDRYIRDRNGAYIQACGHPLAILFQYTCHATSGPDMACGGYHISADYPGAAAGFIEEAYKQSTVALFLQGCAGNVRPRLETPDGQFRKADWPEIAAMGRELGSAAVAAAEAVAFGRLLGEDDADEPTLAAVRATELLPFNTPPTQEELRRLLQSGWPDGSPFRATDRLWAEKILGEIEDGSLPRGSAFEVQLFRMNDVWLVTLPGEIFQETGWCVQESVAKAAGVASTHVIVSAYANGSVGYVPTAEAIREGGYEPNAYRHQGMPACYVSDAQELIATIAGRLARSTMEGSSDLT